MTLITCRATINLVGARAGELLDVDPEDPATAVHIEKGYLVPVDSDVIPDVTVAESGDETGGEGDADELLDAGAAVRDDAEATLETVGDGVDELPASAT